MKNCDVMKHFINGTKCSTKLMYSDGDRLFYKSYKIGETLEDGSRVIYDYSGGDGDWIDQSLSNIIRAALRKGVPVMNKKNQKNS